MLVLDRYVTWIAIRPVLIGLIGIMAIFSIFNFASTLREAVVGEALLDQLVYRVLLRNVVVLDVLLPSTFFFGIVYARSNWHREREAHAFYASGTSPWRVERPLFLLTLLVALLTLLITTTIRPWGYQRLAALDLAAAERLLSTVAPGDFSETQGVVATARRVDQATGEMQDVFAYRNLAGRSEIIRSQSARLGERAPEGSVPITFFDGDSYGFDGDNALIRHTRFDRMVYRLTYHLPTRPPRRQTKSIAELDRHAQPRELAEYQWRLTIPAVAGLLGWFGIAIGRQRPDASAYPRFILGIVVYVLVFNISSATRSAVENQQIDAWPGVFWVPIAMALLFASMTAIRGNRADHPA